METKVCGRCDRDLPLSEFKATSRSPKPTVKCQECRDAENAKRAARKIRPDHLDDSYVYCTKGEHWVLKDIEIYKRTRSPTGYGYGCKMCDAPRMAFHDKAYKKRLRSWLDSLKDSPCHRCGTKYPPYVMDWHHRDPSTKLFNMASAHRIKDREKILAEAAKCDLYCSNCHRIITHTAD